MIVHIYWFSSALGTFVASARRHQVVHLDIGVPDALLGWAVVSTSWRVVRLARLLFVLLSLLAFLLVSILMIDSIIEILIVQFFVVAV